MELTCIKLLSVCSVGPDHTQPMPGPSSLPMLTGLGWSLLQRPEMTGNISSLPMLKDSEAAAVWTHWHPL